MPYKGANLYLISKIWEKQHTSNIQHKQNRGKNGHLRPANLTSCGKSFLVCAIGRQECHQGFRTEYLNMHKFTERIALVKLEGIF